MVSEQVMVSPMVNPLQPQSGQGRHTFPLSSVPGGQRQLGVLRLSPTSRHKISLMVPSSRRHCAHSLPREHRTQAWAGQQM